MTHEDLEQASKCLAKIAEKNLNRVKDRLLEDMEMPLMERKAMMSIAKNAAQLMAYSMSMTGTTHDHTWIKI